MPETHRAPVRAQLFLRSPEAFATPLLLLVLDRLGPECLGWHPETLRMEIRDEFGVEPSEGNFDRIMTAIAVVTTDVFFKNLPRFIHLANVLAGGEFQPDSFEPADASECAWAVTEALILDPPEEKDPFSDDIRRYLGIVLRNEGIISPPDILRLAIMPEGNSADHPEFADGIRQKQSEKTDEIEGMLRDNLRQMTGQIRDLELRTGDTSEFLRKAEAVFRGR